MSLRLDPAIAAWVMAPLLVLVMLVNYARMYAMRLVQPAPDAGGDKKQLQYRNVLARAARLRAFGGLISQAGWQMRHEWLLAPVVGKLHDKNVADANPMDAVGGSNSGMMDNMKGMVRRREDGEGAERICWAGRVMGSSSRSWSKSRLRSGFGLGCGVRERERVADAGRQVSRQISQSTAASMGIF